MHNAVFYLNIYVVKIYYIRETLYVSLRKIKEKSDMNNNVKWALNNIME